MPHLVLEDGLGDACDGDDDADGVADAADLCEETLDGAVVDPASGCAVAQLCPCVGPMGTDLEWSRPQHDSECVHKGAESFYKKGLITKAARDALRSAANASSCGANTCKNKALKSKNSASGAPFLVLNKVSFTTEGPAAPAQFRVFAGATEVFPNSAGNYLVLLRNAVCE